MSEIRLKVSEILNTGNENQNNTFKKEYTNGIVNELKSKIQNFKNKKSNEKDNRSNELDIEVSKDMLSKFRKAEAQNPNLQLNNKESDSKVIASFPQTSHNKSGSLSAGGKKLDTLLKEINFSSNENQNVKSNISQLNQLNQSSNSLTGTEENKYNKIYDTKENQENSKNYINRPSKSFLNTGSEHRNTSEDKKVIIENKRSTLLEQLSVKVFDPRKGFKKIERNYNLNLSDNSTKSIDDKKGGIKDKIKNFVFEMDSNISSKNNRVDHGIIENKTSNRRTNFSNKSNDVYNRIFSRESKPSIIIPTNTNSKVRSLITPVSHKSFSSYNPSTPGREDSYRKQSNFLDYKSNNNNLYSNKSNSNSELGIKYSKNIIDDEFFSAPSKFDSKSKEPFKNNALKMNAEEIKKLSTQLRFLPSEEIRRLDDNLVEELISLSNTISKIFEWKIKTREYKSK